MYRSSRSSTGGVLYVQLVCAIKGHYIGSSETYPHNRVRLFCSNICRGRYLNIVTSEDPVSVTGYGETTCLQVYYSGMVDFSIPADVCSSLRDEIGDICCYAISSGTANDMWCVRGFFTWVQRMALHRRPLQLNFILFDAAMSVVGQKLSLRLKVMELRSRFQSLERSLVGMSSVLLICWTTLTLRLVR